MEINRQEKKNCQDYTSIHCRSWNLNSGSLSPQTVLLISGAGKFFVKGQLVNIMVSLFIWSLLHILYCFFLKSFKNVKPILAHRRHKYRQQAHFGCGPYVICWLILHGVIKGLSTQWVCYCILPLGKSYMPVI